MENLREEESGAAVTLAIFTVFVILTGVVALNTFETGYTRQLDALQQRMALDTVKAVASAIEAELNDSLSTAIAAAMFEVGQAAGTKDEVEVLLRDYFNQRIAAGWSYSNFNNIDVPLGDENSLLVQWLPNGGLRAYGYLDASFEHVLGAKAYGIKLEVGVVPRYGRMRYVAFLAYDEAGNAPDLAAYQNELNDNYSAERFSFIVYRDGGTLNLTLNDLYGGRVTTTENEG